MTPMSSLGHPTPTGSLKRKRLSGEHHGRSLGWEDVQTLVDGEQRPIVWTKANTILSAHPSQPYIVGRIPILSTSAAPQKLHQFTLPSPDTIALNASDYSPASILLLAPTDNHLFAYFPSSRMGERVGIEGGPTTNMQGGAENGAAVIWERNLERSVDRASEVDCWTVATVWAVSPVDAVVGGKWIGQDRDYYTVPSPSASGFSVLRPPPSGPESSPNVSHLLLILASNNLQLCTRPIGNNTGRVALVRSPLGQPYERFAGSPDGQDELSKAHPRSARVLRAAIGYIPNEQGVLIATQLSYVGSPPAQAGMSLSLLDPSFGDAQGGLVPRQQEADVSSVGEAWRESLQLCEIRLRLTGHRWSVTCSPLAPIAHDAPASSHLTGLDFLPLSLSRLSQQEDKEEDMFTPPEAPAEEQGEEEEALGLLATFIDYQYADPSPPTSTLRLWKFQREPVSLCSAFIDMVDDPSNLPEKDELMEWAPTLLASRTFPDHVINLLPDPRGARTGKLLLGLIHTGPEARLGKSEIRARRGELRLVQSLLLTDDLTSRPTPLAYKRELPLSLSACCSPNALYVTLTSPPHVPPRTLFAPYPSRAASVPWPTNPDVDPPAGALVQAFLNISDMNDVARALWQHSAQKEAVVDQLRLCWDTLDQVRGMAEMTVPFTPPASAAHVPEAGAATAVSAGPTTASPEMAKKSPSKTPAKSPETGTGPGTVGSTAAASTGSAGAGVQLSRQLELDCSPWTIRFVEHLVGIYKACPDPEVAKAWETCYDITKLVACERAFLVSRQKREEKTANADGTRTTIVMFETKNTWNLIAWSDWFLDLSRRIVADAIVQRAWELCDEQGPEESPSLKAGRVPHPPPSALLLMHPMSLPLIVFTLKYVREFIEWMSKISPTTEQAYIVQCSLQDAVDRCFLDLNALEEVLGGVQGQCKVHFANSSSPLSDFREAFISVSVPKSLCPLSLEIARLLTSHPSLANKVALLISPSDLLETMLLPPSDPAKDEAQRDVISRLAFRPGAVLRTCLRCGAKNEASSPQKRPLSISWMFYEEAFNKKCLFYCILL
ncbi:hypothetical protein DACRYDRAFT_116795 [Dacryopinax primogenitus]|uniref:Mediator complex subunit 16 n=1 Tax=Dacryopinax primogenitus (strain DJM 731) TaxID=1858805 RepID=M5FYH2_DACPD|nr:uncharacterized protein DACRYDRAFT_116795 [Dacryopinax primogenitus]EJU00910.1 hypothetical protein DACRYDRAFT_116795 [Dacryopinax primogenitus]